MRSWGRFCIAGFLLLAGSVFCAAEEKGEPATIDAQELSFDRPANMAYGTGDVVIHYKDATLRADKVRFNTATKDVWADGNVRLNRAGQEWVAPSMQYNLDTKDLHADAVRGFFDPVFIRADSVSLVASNQYRAPNATATTCDYDDSHYRVRAQHAEIFPDDRMVLWSCSMWLGNVPVMWFPVVIWSLKGDNPPLTLSIGDKTHWGFFVLSAMSFKLDRNLELTLHADERTQHGVMPGADVKYQLGSDGEGLLRGAYLNDADPRETADPTAGKTLPRNRYFVEWQHRENLPGDTTLTLDLNKQSDRDLFYDFYPNEYRSDSEPTSVADLTKRGDFYTLSVLARPQFNNFYAEDERLPEAKLAVNRTRLFGTPFYYEGETSAGYYNNVAGLTSNALFTGDATRVDTFHQIVSPQVLFGWLSVVPRAGGRYTYYSRAPSTAPETNDVSRWVADLGAEASFKLTRTWTGVQSPRLGIDGLRHILEPFADYAWIPAPNVKSNELFQFDTIRSFTVSNSETFALSRYVPLDFPANEAIDAIGREDTVRFGLRQRLQTRHDGQPWDLIELTGWTDFHVERNNGERDFSDLYGTMEIRPSDWVALRTFTRYDLQAGLLREINNEFRVGNADQWSIGVGTRYLRNDSNLIAGNVTWRLTRNWVAQVYQRFDMQDGTWEEQNYVLRQETHDWLITYGFRYLNQRTSGTERAFYVAVTLKALPGAKLAVN